MPNGVVPAALLMFVSCLAGSTLVIQYLDPWWVCNRCRLFCIALSVAAIVSFTASRVIGMATLLWEDFMYVVAVQHLSV